jgi:hypothetical protein
MRFVGPRLFAPATVLVAGLGVWLVLDSHQWHFRQLWSELAIGLFAGVLVIGAGFQSGAAIGTERVIAGGDPDRSRRRVTHWAWGLTGDPAPFDCRRLGHDRQTLNRKGPSTRCQS